MDIKEALASHFPHLETDENLQSECVSLCQNYNISPDDLYYKWEAMSYSGLHAHLTNSSRPALSSKDIHMISMGLQRDLLLKSKKGRPMNQASPVVNIKAKHDSGVTRPVVMTKSSIRPSVPRVSFKGPSKAAEDKKERSFRYMYEKFSDRSTALDERIDKISALVKDHYELDDLGDSSLTTEDEVVVVGRICAEADSAQNQSGKLSENNIFLESSRMGGSGTRVLLRFDSALTIKGGVEGSAGLGIFPGAIVVLKGRNGAGEWFAVSEIWNIPRLPSSPEATGSSSHKSSSFSMCIASGPYTSDADLNYVALKPFFDKLTSTKPAVLLMLGPFLDASHPTLASGDVEQPPSELFDKHFSDKIRDFLEASPDSTILLLPSVRDILSDHAVFPQSEFMSELCSDPRVQMLPNPCRFLINEIEFAACSVDVLSHIRSQEIIKRGQEIDSQQGSDAPGNDTMANACRHVLQQRSFYPLFPVPLDFSRDVNLDVSHSEILDVDYQEMKGHYSPDVMILPSRLKQFSKIVDSTTFINPGWVSKGFFTTIKVETGQNQLLKERMKAEISKL